MERAFVYQCFQQLVFFFAWPTVWQRVLRKSLGKGHRISTRVTTASGLDAWGGTWRLDCGPANGSMKWAAFSRSSWTASPAPGRELGVCGPRGRGSRGETRTVPPPIPCAATTLPAVGLATWHDTRVRCDSPGPFPT